ncbi:hypothetical protein CEXT_718021 [Caerostris extrusa]|uniref:Uncharacterized protein n=1 Tax=Caerostris extrusa TaxID=172846 RepID=A0AAV4VHP0_CAEEX|nr:hypothetical protein CEXT_718021 [Caerostris extrusa]
MNTIKGFSNIDGNDSSYRFLYETFRDEFSDSEKLVSGRKIRSETKLLWNHRVKSTDILVNCVIDDKFNDFTQSGKKRDTWRVRGIRRVFSWLENV